MLINFIPVGKERLKAKTGIFPDVFMDDSIPDFYPLRMLHSLYCYLLRKITYSEVGAYVEKNAIKRAMYLLLRHIPVTFALKEFDRIGIYWSNKPRCRYERNLSVPYLKNGHLGSPKSYRKKHVILEFEGHKFPCILEYDEYLTIKYGNYMQMPPKKERVGHPSMSKLQFPGEKPIIG